MLFGISATTLNGYVTVAVVFFAALAAQPSLPKWLTATAVTLAGVSAAARIAVGHIQTDPPQQSITGNKEIGGKDEHA